MGQFSKIFKFELKGYLTNKVFVGVTALIVVVLAVVLFFPRVMGFFDSDEPGDSDAAEPGERDVMLVSGGDESVRSALAAAFPGYDVRLENGDVKAPVTNGQAACAVELHGLTDFVYYVDNLSMYDTNADTISRVLTELYRLAAMTEAGVSPEKAQEIMSAAAVYEVRSLGVDQGQNFFYTYIMIFALYMVILLYGQMVATNVATEKSSRAMEVLVTSARPTAMMFGKVVASCLAGFTQLVCIFGSALLFYKLNESYWAGTELIGMFFDMPVSLLVYMLVFFVLGFFIYAFLYGAIGSTASKLEDINTSVMPITMLFIAGFFVVVTAMSSGSVDNPLMVACSYIPFTSPMAMFTRIAMSHPAFYEVAISIAILAASCVGVGIVAAKIYRVGVLLYGASPKLKDIIKAVKNA